MRHIDADALLEKMTVNSLPNDAQHLYLAMRGMVRNAPTADVVEVKHGEWVEGAEHFTNGLYEAECSVCNNYIRWNEGNSGDWNYCPNCGAKMDGNSG